MNKTPDEIGPRPDLWEQSFRTLLDTFRKQAGPNAKCPVSDADGDAFIAEVKGVARGEYGDDNPKAQIAVMKKWIFKLAGFLSSPYDPENQGAVPWSQFTQLHPDETSSLTLPGLLRTYSNWAGKTEPAPDMPPSGVAPDAGPQPRTPEPVKVH